MLKIAALLAQCEVCNINAANEPSLIREWNRGIGHKTNATICAGLVRRFSRGATMTVVIVNTHNFLSRDSNPRATG
jgi:hypothetical protein